MNVLRIAIAATLAAAATASPVRAQQPSSAATTTATKAASAAAPTLADGVVESVDAGKGLVTLKHGDIVSIQMPAMTMTFSVADRKSLASLKPGDRLKFQVEIVNNAPTIVRIEPAR